MNKKISFCLTTVLSAVLSFSLSAQALEQAQIPGHVWEALSDEERERISANYITSVIAADTYGTITETNTSSETVPGSNIGSQIGAVIASAAYIGLAAKNSGNSDEKGRDDGRHGGKDSGPGSDRKPDRPPPPPPPPPRSGSWDKAHDRRGNDWRDRERDKDRDRHERGNRHDDKSGYSVAGLLASALVGAVIGSIFDSPAKVRNRTHYTVRLGDGNIVSLDGEQNEGLQLVMTGRCVGISRFEPLGADFCSATRESVLAQYAAPPQSGPAAIAGRPVQGVYAGESEIAGIRCKFGNSLPIALPETQCLESEGKVLK